MPSSNRQILEQKQTTRLWIAPQQKLLGRLLEMSGNELEEEVRRATEENPALEVADTPQAEQEHLDRDEDGEVIRETADDMMKADYRSEDDIPFYRLNASNRSSDDEDFEPEAVGENSVFDFLMAQIGERDLSEKQQLIAQYIIGNISDSGYLQRSIESITFDIMDHTGLNVSDAEVDRVYQLVRELDPAGVGATDLRDCLLLQLERMRGDQISLLAYRVIDECFDLFSKKHFDKIAAQLGIDDVTMRRVFDLIRSLNPKPGNTITEVADDSHSQQISPDFSVETDGADITVTLLNSVPELQISESYSLIYEQYASKKPASDKDRDIAADVKDKYSKAGTFIAMLRQRNETLFRTMRAIVHRQKLFFLTGDTADLKPMVLKDIAADLSLDVSVISRVTRNKYVATEWGIFPLKYFFSEGMMHLSGEEVSTREVLSYLQQLIDGEDKGHPLSDEKLCDLLRDKGYEIARRTIAKYRERLAIPVARLRKEL